MSPWPSSPWSASTRPIRRPQTFYNALPQFGAIYEPGLELSALRTAGVRTCNSGDRIPMEGATWRTPLPSIPVALDLLCDTPSRGNDGLPKEFCSAGPTPDLRPRPPGGGTGDHSHARVPGQRTPLRPFVSLPVAAAPGRAI